jgi:hypothetical protein
VMCGAGRHGSELLANSTPRSRLEETPSRDTGT